MTHRAFGVAADWNRTSHRLGFWKTVATYFITYLCHVHFSRCWKYFFAFKDNSHCTLYWFSIYWRSDCTCHYSKKYILCGLEYVKNFSCSVGTTSANLFNWTITINKLCCNKSTRFSSNSNCHPPPQTPLIIYTSYIQLTTASVVQLHHLVCNIYLVRYTNNCKYTHCVN